MIFGSGGGLTTHDLKAMAERSKFSDRLPWISYNPKSLLYRNQDKTHGYMWECSPLSFGGEKTQTTLEGLFRSGFPEGTIMQFIMHADDHIEPFLQAHRDTVYRDIPIARESTESICRFYQEGTKGLKSLSGIPIRNFRCFVALKFPTHNEAKMRGVNLAEIHTSVTEVLKGAMLSPRPVDPPVLLDWIRRFLNVQPSLNNFYYDNAIPIRKQAILDAVVERKGWSSVQIGDKIFRCISPKLYPNEVNLFQTNQLMGGVWGVTSDADQIRTPFLSCVNVIFNNLKAKLHTKCNITLQQQAVGSFAPSLARKKDEFLWATDQIEKGTQFVQAQSFMWVWGKDESSVTESLTRAKRIYELQGYVMQEDRGILVPLFISSLPFGLYDTGNNIQALERDHIASPDGTASILPVQADFAGCSSPVLTFVGRKGQICGIDIFHESAINNNMFCAASSGAGKSFLVNAFLYGYYKNNAMVRIIDIGGSYKKLTRMLGGKFLDFAEESDICINPFGSIVDIKEDLSVITAIITQMIFSTQDKAPDDIAETASTLIKNAILWAYENVQMEGEIAGVDHVYDYLRTYPDKAKENEFHVNSASLEKTKEIAHMLAYNLTEFTTGYRYGRWFNGKSTLDISKDEFVCLELEKLKPQKELFKVVTLQILNAVTNDLYLSDRSRKRVIGFDEAWQFLSGKNEMLADVIEGGYRRARKYGGSFSVITQAITDVRQWGRAGEAIMNSSAFKFFLEAPNYDAIRETGLIEYDPFVMKMLKSVRTNKPLYSEIFMDSPFGIGIVRLVVDAYSYFIYTSSAKEVAEIEQLMKDGMSNDEAIHTMVQKYRGN